MSGDTEAGLLPTGPSSLCFNKDEFMKENFSVDKFICDNRKHVALETLREDLNIYLRILKNAMIELINKDYADFVNLSTNLVGLDRVINNLTLPVGQLKEEILSVKSSMDDVVNTMKEKLSKRQQIRDQKALLEHLMSISHCVDKIEKLLNIGCENEEYDRQMMSTKREVQSDLIERVAAEFNQLHFHLNKTKGHIYSEKIKSRITYIAQVLQQNLEQSFLNGLNKKDVEQLRRCLRIYATIDRTREVEDIFRQNIVHPFIEKCIPENLGKIDSENLQMIYIEVLQFIPKYCDLLKLASKGSHSSEVIHDYDFIVNAIWPEFATRIEVRMPVILMPVVPDSFHEKFLITMNFLEQFEQLCGSQVSVKRLRGHSSYTSFMNKWNLPVYFQIRFQEIAGKLELAFLSPWDETKNESSHLSFLLVSTTTLWDCINLCWSSKVYLPQLCHRFWKLTLQLLSRYSEWIRTVATSLKAEQEKDEALDALPNSLDLSKQTNNGLDSSKLPLLNLMFVVSDIILLDSKLALFFSNTVEPSLKGSHVTDYDFLKESLEEVSSSLTSQLPQLRLHITREISAQCILQLKLVSDIPRLYRRTNREVPNKASSYVANTLEPLQKFNEHCGAILPKDMRKEWGLQILDDVLQQYYNMTLNVLTSIKKMEESLSRLKKTRDKGNIVASGSSSGTSDDDKIRYQLFLDVENFGKQIEELNFETSNLEIYQNLVELVESARNSPSKIS